MNIYIFLRSQFQRSSCKKEILQQIQVQKTVPAQVMLLPRRKEPMINLPV